MLSDTRGSGWSRLRLIAALSALLFAFCLQSKAKTLDYETDFGKETLAISKAESTLGDFLKLCADQTHLSYIYQPDSLPLDQQLVLPLGAGRKLSYVFMSVTLQSKVVFLRINDQVAVRMQKDDDVLKPLGDEVKGGAKGDQDEVFTLEPVTVVAEKLKAEQVMLQMRMQDVRFINMLSSEDFSRLGLSDMGEAATKVAGVNVAEGRFAVIRGLSERYSATLVNGIPMPSPDPMKQGVHLDLFSSDIVDRLEVYKTFSPDAPGNASGGYINIVTSNIPYDSFAKVSFGMKFNDRAQRDYVTYDNPGRNDSWAQGYNDRLPYSYAQGYGFINMGASYSLPKGIDMVPQHESPPPGLSFEVSFGTGDFALLWGRHIRAMGSVSYDSSYKTTDGTYEKRWVGSKNNRIYQYTGYLDAWLGLMTVHGPQYDYTRSVASVDITALGAIQMDLDRKGAHKITLNTFVSQAGTDTVLKMENGVFNLYDAYNAYEDAGYSTWSQIVSEAYGSEGLLYKQFDNDGEAVLKRKYNWDLIYYEQRKLCSVQLLGDHNLSFLSGDPFKLSWVYGNNRTYTKEPDSRSIEYYYDSDTGLFKSSQANDDGSNNYRSWRNISEKQHFFRADLSYDWFINRALEWKLSAGAYYDDDARHVAQNFTLFKTSAKGETAEDVYNEHSFFNLSSSIRRVNTGADRIIKAGYLNGVLTLWNQFDIIAGQRVENLEFDTSNNYVGDAYKVVNFALGKNAERWGLEPGPDGSYINGGLYQTYWLPDFGLAWHPLEGFALRLNYSRTTARPSFREMMAYLAFTPDDLQDTMGNPQLKPSKVRSTDLRAEYTWGKQGNLLAASVFYKEVDNPVEKVLGYSPSAIYDFYTWINNPNTAYLHGFELEWRTHLDFLGMDWLDNLSIGGNFSHIDAIVRVPDGVLAGIHNMGYINSESDAEVMHAIYGDVPEDAAYVHYPKQRRLYDQPEWIVNADISYEIKKSDTTMTLAYYAISDVLDSAGALGFSGSNEHDTYFDSYNRLDFIIRQKLFDKCYLKFGAKNLTDSPRAIIYNPETTSQKYYRLKYHTGRDFSLSISYEF
ncbi:MAG: TonB-dependent receptor [Opitutales bacterium]|jgi:outer membrane receptor protein involved in Fe transport